jgi:hypothetical protein
MSRASSSMFAGVGHPRWVRALLSVNPDRELGWPVAAMLADAVTGRPSLARFR